VGGIGAVSGEAIGGSSFRHASALAWGWDGGWRLGRGRD
jgi:hypothetical protein